jgi:DNA-binding CsgD family transcriptional regulator
MAYFGVSLLGLAFVLFALLEDSVTGFYLTITALEAAFALIAVFLWVLLGNLSLQYGAPYLFFGYGLFANIMGTFAGGLYGDDLLRTVESPQLLTALYALAAIFAALVAVPWLVEKAGAGSPGAASQDDLPPLSLLPENALLEALALEAGLTERETGIVELLLQGCSNQTISQHLFISENTVKTHLRNIFRKVGVRNRNELLIRVAGRTIFPDQPSAID